MFGFDPMRYGSIPTIQKIKRFCTNNFLLRSSIIFVNSVLIQTSLKFIIKISNYVEKAVYL